MLDRKLQCLLEWVLFETGPFTHAPDAAKGIKSVPAPYAEHSTKASAARPERDPSLPPSRQALGAAPDLASEWT